MLQSILFSIKHANPQGLLVSLSFFLLPLFFWKFRLVLARYVHWILFCMLLAGTFEALALVKAMPSAAAGGIPWESIDFSMRLDLAKIPALAIFIGPAFGAIGLLCASLGIRSKEGIVGILVAALSLAYFGLGHWLLMVLFD